MWLYALLTARSNIEFLSANSHWFFQLSGFAPDCAFDNVSFTRELMASLSLGDVGREVSNESRLFWIACILSLFLPSRGQYTRKRRAQAAEARDVDLGCGKAGGSMVVVRTVRRQSRELPQRVLQRSAGWRDGRTVLRHTLSHSHIYASPMQRRSSWAWPSLTVRPVPLKSAHCLSPVFQQNMRQILRIPASVIVIQQIPDNHSVQPVPTIKPSYPTPGTARSWEHEVGESLRRCSLYVLAASAASDISLLGYT